MPKVEQRVRRLTVGAVDGIAENPEMFNRGRMVSNGDVGGLKVLKILFVFSDMGGGALRYVRGYQLPVNRPPVFAHLATNELRLAHHSTLNYQLSSTLVSNFDIHFANMHLLC